MHKELPYHLELELWRLGIIPKPSPKEPEEPKEKPPIWDGKGECPF